MSIDLFDPEDFGEAPPKDWKPPAIQPLATPVQTMAVLVTKRSANQPEAIDALQLTEQDLCCPRCTEPMSEDRFILDRSDGQHILCSLICAIRFDRVLGTGFQSSIRPSKSSTNRKNSGHF